MTSGNPDKPIVLFVLCSIAVAIGVSGGLVWYNTHGKASPSGTASPGERPTAATTITVRGVCADTVTAKKLGVSTRTEVKVRPIAVTTAGGPKLAGPVTKLTLVPARGTPIEVTLAHIAACDRRNACGQKVIGTTTIGGKSYYLVAGRDGVASLRASTAKCPK